MAIIFVQAVTGSGATLVLTGTAGNTLIFVDSLFRNPSTGVPEAIPADSNGTFIVSRAGVPATFSGADLGLGIWHQDNILGGTHTVTPGTGHSNAVLMEFSGLTSISLDQVNDAKTNSGSQTSQVTGTTPTTTVADELVVIGLGLGAAVGVADVGFTDPVSGFLTTLKVSNDATSVAAFCAYKIISATGTQAATFNWTDNEANQGSHAAIATFKAAATAGNIAWVKA